MRQHQTEPPAAMRQWAAVMWQAYVALTSEGFSESQAIMLVTEFMANAQLAADLDDSDNG